ncbi:zinc-dependent alcohol dehydrogenase family protein [Streptomyces albus subsp. chlorinus]|uniref:zinc-dependent alcohol dehydrogenase family protein n=1 Tax=Streptomyces albus TaxID=1888 RepID=UPI00156DA674|nr:zinc-dependent alcohol dehydrogenase family protein [Streptomyces albus]NSC22982.1 zinc-dependent alcohol dehydrogenase family protein [Streptomyces albus subsp. chlorinus]
MRALVFGQYGDPGERLRLVELPRPAPAPGQVRVKLVARPVNPSDLLYVRGEYGRPARFSPLPGCAGQHASPAGFEGAGVIDAVGAGVTGPRTGTRVAVSALGTWQEYVCAPADSVVAVPAGVPLDVAAQMTVNPFTAHLLLRAAGVGPADTVVLTAGASAVSRMIGWLARRGGIRCVCVVRRESQLPLVRALGAEPVLLRPGRSLADDLGAALPEGGADAVLDAVGGPEGGALVRSLRPGGRLLLYGLLSGRPLHIPPADLVFRDVSVEGFWLPTSLERLDDTEAGRLTDQVRRDVCGGMPGMEVGSSHDLSAYAAALADVARPGRTEKVLLRS